MRKVLAVITALMLGAIVFAPVTGYTFKTEDKPVFTTSPGPKANFSFGTGLVAHEMAPGPIPPILPTFSIGSKAMPYTFKLGDASQYSAVLETNAGMIALGSKKARTTLVLGKGLKTPSWAVTPKDPCEGVSCPEGQACENGVCVALPPVDPCEGVTCPEGQSCENGTCVAIIAPPADPCENITCPEGQICQNGECICAEAPCGEECCTRDQICENGTCITPVKKLSIMGIVFDDVNLDGIKDENDTGLAGWVVDLAFADETVINSTVTADDGSYAFAGLDPGDYMVIEILQADWAPVPGASGKLNVTLVDTDAINVGFPNMYVMPTPPPMDNPETMPPGNNT